MRSIYQFNILNSQLHAIWPSADMNLDFVQVRCGCVCVCVFGGGGGGGVK